MELAPHAEVFVRTSNTTDNIGTAAALQSVLLAFFCCCCAVVISSFYSNCLLSFQSKASKQTNKTADGFLSQSSHVCLSLTRTRLFAASLQERGVGMQLGNLTSMPKQLAMGLPQGSPKSSVLYNVYTKGLVDLNSNGLSGVLTHAYDRLVYKTASDTHTAVTVVQEWLEKVSQWCQETESKISLSKAQALWCTFNNRAVGQAMPAVFFNGKVIEWIYFARMLICKMQADSTKPGAK